MSEVFCDKCKKHKCISRGYGGRVVFDSAGHLKGYNAEDIEQCPAKDDTKVIQMDFESQRKTER